MNTIKPVLTLILWIGVLLHIQFAAAQDTVHIWYGNPDNTPIWAVPGVPTRVDVWIGGTMQIPIGSLHICLGTLDSIIDSIYGCLPLKPSFCNIQTLAPEHSPPNSIGWSSRSVLVNCGNNPLITTYPVRVFSYFTHTINDTTLIGDTILCLGTGVNSIYGHSAVSDTAGGTGYTLAEHFSSTMITHKLIGYCTYLPGDMNGDCLRLPNDVTFGVRYFKGLGNHPPDTMSIIDLPDVHPLYTAADVNGDCKNSGADVTFLVGYFKGKVLNVRFCPILPSDPYQWPR